MQYFHGNELRETVVTGRVDRERVYSLDTGGGAARYVARHPYAWPGGYDLVLIMTDGGVLCADCVRANYRQILESVRDYSNVNYGDGWTPAGYMLADDPGAELICDHCSKTISGEDE